MVRSILLPLAVAAGTVAIPAHAQQRSVRPPVQALLDEATKLDAAGKTAEATTRIESAVALAKHTDPGGESEAAALAMLAEFLAGFDVPRALESAKRSEALRTTLFGADAMPTLRERMVVALLIGLTGDKGTQVTMLGDVLDRMERVATTPAEREEVATSRAAYAMTLVQVGRDAEAKPVIARAAALFDADPKPRHTAIDGYSTIAMLETRWGMYNQAIAHADKAIALGRAAVGASHPDLIPALQYRAEALLANGQLPEAEAGFREALAVADKAQPPTPIHLFRLTKSLANLYTATNRFALAAPLYDRLVERIDVLLPSSALRATTYANRAQSRRLAGDIAGSIADERKALEVARAIDPDGRNAFDAALTLADSLLDQANPAEAEQIAVLAKAYAPKLTPGDIGHAKLAALDGRLALARGELEMVRVAYDRALAALATAPAADLAQLNIRKAAAEAMLSSGDAAAAWTAARPAADQLTTRISNRAARFSDAGTIPAEARLFDTAIDAAWAREAELSR